MDSGVDHRNLVVHLVLQLDHLVQEVVHHFLVHLAEAHQEVQVVLVHLVEAHQEEDNI